MKRGGESLYLFGCSYKNRDSNSKNDSRGTACLVQSDRFRSIAAPVEIVTRDWTEVMLSDKVDMGESPFSQNFLVQSKDPGSARRVVNESIQATLIEHLNKPTSNHVSVIIGPGGAVVMTAGKTAEQESLQEILDLARRLESAVN